jgi:hypothetical protein
MKIDKFPFTVEDIRVAREVMRSRNGFLPNCLMIGGDAAKAAGVEPGVYVTNDTGGVTYYTFEEWDAR